MEKMIHMNTNESTPLEAAIAKQIIVELAEHDMTRRQLAEALGIEEATLSRYLNGKRSMPMTTFFKVADVFGLDQVELLRRSKARLSD
jgi:transcriptional regulator with XRE-family HTH domain